MRTSWGLEVSGDLGFFIFFLLLSLFSPSLCFFCSRGPRPPRAGTRAEAPLKSKGKPSILSGFDHIQSKKTQEPLVFTKLIFGNFDFDEPVALALIPATPLPPQAMKQHSSGCWGPGEAQAGPAHGPVPNEVLQAQREEFQELGAMEAGVLGAPGIGVEEGKGSPRSCEQNQLQDGQGLVHPARPWAVKAHRRAGCIQRAGFATKSPRDLTLSQASVSSFIKWV